MPDLQDFASLYTRFTAPILELDCGTRCAPYNGGVPVCCDTRHTVPTAYPAEWTYLLSSTDLWHVWQPADAETHRRLAREAGPDLVLIECLGAEHCQRDYRSIVCRAFPFFPYVTAQGEFLGLSGYQEYEDRCWVLSNLSRVTPTYRAEFVAAYDRLFDLMPDERTTFQAFTARLRTQCAASRQYIPLLHRDGHDYQVDPASEDLKPIRLKDLPKHGPFAIRDQLQFPDENP